MFKTKFSPWDAVAAACVLLLAALLFLIPLLGAEEGNVLVISTPDGVGEGIFFRSRSDCYGGIQRDPP